MSLFIDNAIGGWIRNAEQNGELKNNPYNGKAIDLGDYFRTPEALRMGMKILKDANCLPPAVDIMKQIDEKKEELKISKNLEHQQSLKSEIRTLELKKALLLESQ